MSDDKKKGVSRVKPWPEPSDPPEYVTYKVPPIPNPECSECGAVMGMVMTERPTGWKCFECHPFPPLSVSFEAASCGDPAQTDVVVLAGDKELVRVRDQTKAEILAAFGIAAAKEKP